MPSPGPSSPSTAINSARLAGRGTANHSPHHSLSGVSAAKAALNRPSAPGVNRRPTLSSVPLEDRAKAVSLKAEYDSLLAAAEQRESEAVRETQVWKTRAAELAEQISRIESDLARLNETDDRLAKLEKELERTKALAKDHELQLLQQNEEFDTARTAWLQAETQLKARLTSLAAELSHAPKPPSPSPIDPDTEEKDEGHIEFQRSPSFRPPSLAPSPGATGRSNLELETALAEARKEAAEAEALRRAIGVLREQLADAERVNEQLMDDNESYQFLVGERTLMGGFDIKQLLRVEPETPASNSVSGSSLPDVEEEGEEDDGDDTMDDIERAVLESHGNGSRTTGAVEAEVSTTRHKANKSAGLDLAAELAQAEKSEELDKTEERRKKKTSNGKASVKDKDAEIKFLTDANKALVLYISKILDRIQAHEGFEKVLATDYKKDSSDPVTTQSPATATSPTASTGIASSIFNVLTNKSSAPSAPVDRKPLNLAASSSTANAPGPRASWLQFFTASKSSSAASTAGIKPLKLRTGTASLNGNWQGVKEEEEDEEDVRERERLRAELKLHGIDKTASPTHNVTRSVTLDGTATTNKASRRSSSIYGAGSVSSTGAKRLSAEPVLGSPPPITPAGVLKRSEEREKESRANLEKGQASGFTEIEIRGSRLRPINHQKLSTGPLTPTSPILSTNAPSGGMKDLKMGASSAEVANSSPVNEEGGILARTAKRISLMRS